MQQKLDVDGAKASMRLRLISDCAWFKKEIIIHIESSRLRKTYTHMRCICDMHWKIASSYSLPSQYSDFSITMSDLGFVRL